VKCDKKKNGECERNEKCNKFLENVTDKIKRVVISEMKRRSSGGPSASKTRVSRDFIRSRAAISYLCYYHIPHPAGLRVLTLCPRRLGRVFPRAPISITRLQRERPCLRSPERGK